MRVLCLIPARGGSKRIPKKNLALLSGQPLVTHAVVCASRADICDRIIVSTDDEEIASVALEAGAEVPFRRPASLARDRTRDQPVFEHALRWLATHDDYRPDIVLHIRPTSPLRVPDDLRNAVRILAGDARWTAARSVSEVEEHPYRALRMESDSQLVRTFGAGDAVGGMRRQELPPFFRCNGLADACRRKVILNGKLYGDRVAGFMIPGERALDIDSPWQLVAARAVREWLIARDNRLKSLWLDASTP